MPSVPAKVTARKGAVIALACVANWNMWSNPAANQPAEEMARSISGVSRSRFGFKLEARSRRVAAPALTVEMILGHDGNRTTILP